MKRRNDFNRDSKRYYDWLDRALDDLRAAEILLDNGDALDAAAFHCQQCIEKALKGFILFRTNTHVDGHNLTWLCRQAMKYDHHFIEWLDESAVLNKFYIETRYPSDIPLELVPEQIQKVYEMAKSMYKFICSVIG